MGKTDLSIEIAEKFNGEIISADSRQFYKELNIGTAKPTEEELSRVPHYFVNSHSIDDNYTAGKFEKDGLPVIYDIIKRGRLPIVVGGSGLYIQALIHGIDQPPADEKIRAALNSKLREEGLEKLQELLKERDPDKYRSIDLNNPRRVIRALEIAELKKRGVSSKPKRIPRDFDPIVIVLYRERQELYERINSRADKMIQDGLLNEVETLKASRENQAMQTVGYKELLSYLDAEISLEDAVDLIKQNTRRYAKRQITWFKRMESAKWIPADDKNGLLRYVSEKLS